MIRPLLACLFVGAVLNALPARADLDFANDVTSDGLRYILVSGEFEYTDDLSLFAAEVARGNPSVVTFYSPGGNVMKAMELGRLIRSFGLATMQFRQLECSSACAFAFMGGRIRIADPGAIGVHRSSFRSDLPASSDDDRVQAIQEMTARIMGYLGEMGVDRGLVELILSYGSDDMRYLSGSEMARYGVTTSDAAEENTEGRRPAPMPAPTPPVAPAEPSQQAKAQAAELVQSIIGSHTLPALSAIELVRSSYAAEVDYYGKRQQLVEVLQDKRAYFERWPERFYAVRPGSVSVDCSADHCRVSGIYDWSVRSLPRNRKASGTATFSYVVDMSTGRIVGETSEVISR